MNTDLVNRIKKLTIIALASDDELVASIVLKGGNAIDLAYSSDSTLSRTSFDLDFSIENGDFTDLEQIKDRIKRTLEQTFAENDFIVIDYKFVNRPKEANLNTASFWGGYYVEFKVIERKKYEENITNPEQQTRISIPLRPDNSPKFEIEFSKFEYVGDKRAVKIEGYTVYVYTSEMIVFEKIRAICQQLPEYAEIIKSHTPRARARDFYDIHLIMGMHEIEPNTAENLQLIKNIFEAKKVPLSFIKEIKKHKSIHEDNWNSVRDTISATEQINDFDYYFNYVVNKFDGLIFP